MRRDRRAFRPTLGAALEERVVLSRVAGHPAAEAVHAAAAGAAGPNVGNTPVPLGPVGALGDSYTDEYQFYPPDRSTARNWVEILHALRGVSFGPFTTNFRRGEPRNQGFAYNWARSDATSTDMVNNQLPGLAAQVAAGDIRYAWIFIGGNDYLHLLGGLATGQLPPAQAVPGVVSTAARLQANFDTAVRTLLAANPNVKLVVSTLPDITDVPIARLAAATNPLAALLLQFANQTIHQYDAHIRQTAASDPSRIALVDLAAVTGALSSNPTGTINFDGATVNLLTPGDDYHNFFLGDLYHVGTLGQTVIADLFATAIDTQFGAGLFPVSPQEAVPYARRIFLQATRHGR